MKKLLSVVLVWSLCLTSVAFVKADNQENATQTGCIIEFNGGITEYEAVICDNTYYVPLRKIFEKMGAVVFYRNRDSQILALSRDGNMIRHIVGDNSIIVNGEQKTFETPSISKNYETYIPINMVSASFCPDEIVCDDQKLSIQKCMSNNDYHKVIQDVLDVSAFNNFYPERFQRYISHHAKMPSYSIDEVLFRVNLELDAPFYENVTIIETPDDPFVVVNKHHQLPADFTPANLVSMGRQYTANDGKQYWLSATAYEKYVQMADAARADGMTMRVVSSYRTEDYQRNLYNSRVRTTGKINADNYSARPGFSEHQTGLAVDINSTRGVFEYTPEFKWLQQHAHEYGYIMRYPRGKEWITGYSYEPWHYRYVGEEAAKIIHEEGITYEEFFAKYMSENEFR